VPPKTTPPTLSRRTAPVRREQLLAVAAGLFAERGFAGVTMADIGKAAGISGPAMYHHFDGKEAMLGEMLLSISEHLLEQASAITDLGGPPDLVLERLVHAHVGFSVGHPELITVHFRDLVMAAPGDRQAVRRLQGRYVGHWTDVLVERRPELGVAEARSTAHAVFGLLNSTPYSTMPDKAATAALLERLARRALEL
jgi:AcrR family transcriptional regulator